MESGHRTGGEGLFEIDQPTVLEFRDPVLRRLGTRARRPRAVVPGHLPWT
ncbi:hypothetical protein [Rugosimonospora acidiphila]